MSIVLKIIVVLSNFFCLWTFLSACYYAAPNGIFNYFGSVIALSALSLTYAIFLIVDVFFMKFYAICQWLKIITIIAGILSNIAAYLLTLSLYANLFPLLPLVMHISR
uniref:MARVEL domain-containing protein n=1 Tax=Parascaris univalens TaxID=6257 RepID=A0A915AML2_PARUN